MNKKKRIEYIDALRGFTMILVVAVHIYSYCFMQLNVKEYDLSYNNFFGIFRMPLFYFISGFVFYKQDRLWDYVTLKKFITSKIRVQLFSTLIFFFLFCWLYQKGIKHSLYDSQKSGYWFTYILFIYFVLYIIIDKTVCCLSRKAPFNNITIITSIIVGLLFYYLINNGFLLNILSPQTTTLLSISKWQFFLFFSFGCFIHKYYDTFLKIQTTKYLIDITLLIFACCSISIFYLNFINISTYTSIIKLITALCGIILVISFFKENEKHFTTSTRLGGGLQYIGKHTLDIYFLHYFILPYNLSFIGNCLIRNPNPLLEFSMSLTFALLVIACCLLISNIIRLSPILTYLLLGGKKSRV